MKNPESMPISECPECESREKVEPKLHTFDLAGESYFLETYVVEDRDRYRASPHTDRTFVSALYCRACDIGFIPEALHEALGIAPNRLRGRFGRVRPYGVGEMK